MYMRAVTIRIAYLGVLSLGVLLSAAFRQADVSAAPLQASAPQRSVLPVAAPAPVLLQTVHVRAQASHAAVVANPTGPKVVANLIRQDTAAPADAHGGVSLPTLRMDMPYYSFGKLLPRVGKE